MIEFDKYHGLGNDFVLFDQTTDNISLHSAREIRALCDRRFGVGADGVLYFNVIRKDRSDERGALLRMVYLNSDGSRAETCFNGLRCIGLHAYRNNFIADQETFTILSDAGEVEMSIDAKNSSASMKLNSSPSMRAADIGLQKGLNPKLFKYNFNGKEYEGSAISMGNPHFLSWNSGRSIDDLVAEVDRTGLLVEKSPVFVNGVNFELASIAGEDTIDLAVWERGAGRTLACGSGATATAIIAAIQGKVDTTREIEVRQAGGSLFMKVDAKLHDNGSVKLNAAIQVRGAAAHVFHGSVNMEGIIRS